MLEAGNLNLSERMLCVLNEKRNVDAIFVVGEVRRVFMNNRNFLLKIFRRRKNSLCIRISLRKPQTRSAACSAESSTSRRPSRRRWSSKFRTERRMDFAPCSSMFQLDFRFTFSDSGTSTRTARVLRRTTLVPCSTWQRSTFSTSSTDGQSGLLSG